MTRKPSDKDRIAALEAELQSLRDLVERTQSRLEFVDAAPQVRLAKTISKDDDPGTNPYPSGGTNAFYFKLLEGDFTEEEGSQSLSTKERAAGHSGVMRTVPASYIDANTIVPVFRHARRWFSPVAQPPPIPIVEIHDPGGTPGEDVSPLPTSCVYPGRLVMSSGVDCAGGSWTAGDAVWIFLMDDDAPSDIADATRFLGKESGTYDPGSDERPLYLVQKGNPAPGIVRFETTGPKAYGDHVEAETVEFVSPAYQKTGTAIAVIDTFGVWGPALTGASGFAVARADRELADPGSGDLPVYEILWMENAPEHVIVKLQERVGYTTPGLAGSDVQSHDWGSGSEQLISGHPLGGQNLAGGTLQAWDPLGNWESLKADDIVQLTFFAPENKYHITSLLEAEALFFTSTLGADMASTDAADGKVSTLDPVLDGPFQRAPATNPPAAIGNTYGLAGESGDAVLVRRVTNFVSPHALTYEVVQVKHKQSAMVTDNIVSGTDLKEIKRDCAVMYHAGTYEELNTLPLGGIGGQWLAAAQVGTTQPVDVGTGALRDKVNFLGSDSASVVVNGQCIHTEIENISASEHTVHISHANGPSVTTRLDHADYDDDVDIPVFFGYDVCGHVDTIEYKSPCKWFDDWVNQPTGIPDDGEDYVLVLSKTSGVRNCRLVKIAPCP